MLAAVVSELMSDEGLEVDGVKYTFKVTFGGKPPVMLMSFSVSS
jgi:hypothetical protein